MQLYYFNPSLEDWEGRVEYTDEFEINTFSLREKFNFFFLHTILPYFVILLQNLIILIKYTHSFFALQMCYI